MLFVALILSGILLLAVNVTARQCGRGSKVARVPCVVSVFVGACIPFFLVNSILVGMAALACSLAAAKPRYFFFSSIAATSLVYVGFVVVFAAPELREWSDLKD